ncbi:TetR/AcrR family transcriptional regulator [Pedobacter hartonius]|uniref:Transcriptional regulator, TetR family n=1 Tax=Pedobacter hartonius TaxID=425514 RepID=A0A1H4H9F1_9SPHI|nr:TetR/AcrR family transcriptional regulator [Pedobacter hartonius]SEB18463.1 transcriptional regulator, TetR family [Pedobacter hartonius]
MARTKSFDEETILDEAMKLFWHTGYHSLSAQELVDGLGLSRSSLYDTFGDKHTLYVKALRRYSKLTVEATISVLDQAKNIPKAIKEVFQMNFNASFGSELTKGCFVVNSRVELSPHDPEIAGIVKENWQSLEDGFYRALKRGQEAGQVSNAHNARTLARFFVNNSWGLNVYGNADADEKVFKDIIKVALSVL